MNRIDKFALLRIIIPGIVSCVVAYYTVKYFDVIHFLIVNLVRDLGRLFGM